MNAPRTFLATAVLMTSMVLVTGQSQSAEAAATRVSNGAPGAATIGIIGDSSLAGVRWSDSYGPLSTVNYSFSAESCRRTTTPSCRGREGYAPPTALEALRSRSGQWGSVLVMVMGYNDPGSTFASSVDAIMAEAQRQGIGKVMWLTMRTADVSYVSPTFRSNTYTFRDNNRILLQKSRVYGGRLQVADWATYTADKSSWFTYDGVHYTKSGALGAAAYIAREGARVAAGWNITPGSSLRCAGRAVTHVGTDGNDRLVGSSRADVILGLGGNDTIYGGGGGDVICGGTGNDTIYGGDGDDRLFGGPGRDRIWGDAGHDTLSGG